MKPLSYSLIAAAIACGFAAAQTTAYTTPVGYVTSYIGPNASNNTAGSATFIAPSLVMPTVYAGAATVAPSGKTVTLSEGVPVGLDATSMLEISDGVHEGWWSAVTVSTGTTITLNDDLPAGLAAGVKVSVRKFTTIQDVFGANTPGLTALVDEIQTIPDPAVIPQETKSIVWADGWIDAFEEPSGGDPIYPGTAVKVIRYGLSTEPLSVIVTGEVKMTKTQVDVFPQYNWLGQPNPTGGTLGSMAFGTQVLPTDILELFQTDAGAGQVSDAYVKFGNIMIDAFEEDASAVMIPEGGGYSIYRGSGAASVLTIPAQVVSP